MNTRSAALSVGGFLVGVFAACAPGAVFNCEDDADCGSGGGVCEARVGFCSFPDAECPTGKRYGDHSGGGLGGQCVGGEDGDTGTSTGMTGPSTMASTTLSTLDGSGEGDGTTGGPGDDGTDGGTTGGPSDAAWWNCDYAARRELKIIHDPDAFTETLVDVPILVAVDATRIDYGLTNADGSDVQFVADDHRSLLSSEVEQFDIAGVSFFWVRVPTLAPGTTRFYMYYGNAAGQSALPQLTWATGYVGVYHMAGAGFDATLYGNYAEAEAGASSSFVAGQIGPALAYDGQASEGLVAQSSASLSDLFEGGGTVSAWIRPQGWGGGGTGEIVTKAANNEGDDGWVLAVDAENQTIRFSREFSQSRSSTYGAEGAITLHRWHHVAVVYDEDSPENIATVYIDGLPSDLSTGGNPNGSAESDADNPLTIGGAIGTSDFKFDGIIDEVRLNREPKSAEWIFVQHRSMRDDLVIHGPELSSTCSNPSG